MAFLAGVFTQCTPGCIVSLFLLSFASAGQRGGGGRMWLAGLAHGLILSRCLPSGPRQQSQSLPGWKPAWLLGLLALGVLPSHPASVGAACGPGPCLSARGLGFCVTGPKLGSQGIKCPCCVITLSCPMRPAANSSKGCVYFVWEMLQETETGTKILFSKSKKTRRGQQPYSPGRAGCLGTLKPLPLLCIVSTSTAPWPVPVCPHRP